jgi:hypothetical protein
MSIVCRLSPWDARAAAGAEAVSGRRWLDLTWACAALSARGVSGSEMAAMRRQGSHAAKGARQVAVLQAAQKHMAGWLSAREVHMQQRASCCAPYRQAVCLGHHGGQQQRALHAVHRGKQATGNVCFKWHLGGSVKRGGSQGELIRRPASRGDQEMRTRTGKLEQGRRRGGDLGENDRTGCECGRMGWRFGSARVQPVNQKKIFRISINIFLVNA